MGREGNTKNVYGILVILVPFLAIHLCTVRIFSILRVFNIIIMLGWATPWVSPLGVYPNQARELLALHLLVSLSDDLLSGCFERGGFSTLYCKSLTLLLLLLTVDRWLRSRGASSRLWGVMFVLNVEAEPMEVIIIVIVIIVCSRKVLGFMGWGSVLVFSDRFVRLRLALDFSSHDGHYRPWFFFWRFPRLELLHNACSGWRGASMEILSSPIMIYQAVLHRRYFVRACWIAKLRSSLDLIW